jgi:hypothetical protein
MSATGIDEAKLEQFMGQFVQDLGAALTAPMVLIGDKLGLYKAMADGEPVTPAQLAERTDCRERYIREWLCQQAASGYVEYDAADGTFRLPPEQAMALADEERPASPAPSSTMAATIKDEPQIAERFRSAGVRVASTTPTCRHRAVLPSRLRQPRRVWLPALDGVVEKLTAGARVVSAAATTPDDLMAAPSGVHVPRSDYHEDW